MTRDGHLITCKRRDCAGFSDQWARDQRTRLMHNLGSWRHFMQMATATAPGKDVLPFDTEKCGHPSDGSACSGPAGCVVREVQAGMWNREAIPAMRGALRRTRVAGRRKGIRVDRWRLLAYVPEIERGVIHLHLAFGWTGHVRPGDARWLMSRFKRELVRGGYGKQFKAGRMSHGAGGEQAGSYMAKYMGKSGLEALKVLPAGMQPVYVSPVLTRRTGITMRFLRMARRAWRKWGVCDYALLVRFFAWAREHNVDPFTWHRLPAPGARRGPPEAWVPISSSRDATVQDYAQLHLAFAA